MKERSCWVSSSSLHCTFISYACSLFLLFRLFIGVKLHVWLFSSTLCSFLFLCVNLSFDLCTLDWSRFQDVPVRVLEWNPSWRSLNSTPLFLNSITLWLIVYYCVVYLHVWLHCCLSAEPRFTSAEQFKLISFHSFKIRAVELSRMLLSSASSPTHLRWADISKYCLTDCCSMPSYPRGK